MSDWTEGYVTDVGYTFGYYRALNPLHAKIALQDYNVACPEVQTACELGFGQGMSKDCTLLDSEEENLAELHLRAEMFMQKRLPILNVLGIS